jgi:hypothetical protein
MTRTYWTEILLQTRMVVCTMHGFGTATSRRVQKIAPVRGAGRRAKISRRELAQVGIGTCTTQTPASRADSQSGSWLRPDGCSGWTSWRPPSSARSRPSSGTPPRSVMNWRRLRSSMGSPPEPAVPAYRRLRMPRKRPEVLGVDLNRSESIGVARGPYRQKSLNRSGASSV